MKPREPLPERVLKYINKHGLVSQNELLLVGSSGGPDSLCLLLSLAGIRKELGIELRIVHLNHMLRGAESEADADFVARVGRRLGLDTIIEKRDVREYQKAHSLSLEEAAREVRYAFFSEVAQQSGADKVAVGHTLEDNVETILMHIIRGSGLAGLRGIQPSNVLRTANGARLQVIRPLLDVRHTETIEFCLEQGLTPRTDSSNVFPERLRNDIRARLVPLLKELNPDVETTLLRLSAAAGDAFDHIQLQLSDIWDKIAEEQQDAVVLRKPEFARIDRALKREAVRRAFYYLLGDLRDIESVHIESLVEAMGKGPGKRLDLLEGLSFYSSYREGILAREEAAICAYPTIEGEYPLEVPGITRLPGWEVESSITDRALVPGGDLRACFDLDLTGKDLKVRARRKGDRFQPLGMDLPKKLQDFMVDAKVPRACRHRVPVVTSPQHIIWVVGYRIDQRARITPSTKRVLCLEFRQT